MAEEAHDSVEGLFKALTREEKIKGFNTLVELAMHDAMEFRGDPQNFLLAVAIQAIVRENGGNGIADTVMALVYQGPLWDGDVPSKSHRDILLELDLATRVVVKGEQGFTAARYTLQYIAEAMIWVPEDVRVEKSIYSIEDLNTIREQADKGLADAYDRNPEMMREALVVFAYGLEQLEAFLE